MPAIFIADYFLNSKKFAWPRCFSFQFLEPCLDELGQKPCRRRFAMRKLNRPLGGFVPFQCRGVDANGAGAREEAGMLFECREPHQRTSVQSKSRHSVTHA